MAKKVQLMTNAKEWQTVDGVEVLVDVPQEDLDPITDSNCIEIEGHRTLEETISQENMFTPEIVETKVHSKVGGVYHDNVVDGAYEEAILYGNTQVNLVESMTSGTKYIPHSFTSFQGNESKIGNYHSGRTNQVAPLVKGVTMVNLAQTTSVTIAEGSNGGAIENVKPNTKYTLALDFTVQNTQKGFSIHAFKDNTYLETSSIRTGMGEKVKFTFTTHEEANNIYIVNNSGFGGEIQLDNIMVIEGDVTDLDLPFFKGMRSVELSRPLTNLFTDDLVPERNGVVVTNSGDTITVESTGIYQWASARYYINLKPNTKYVIMWDSLTFTQTASGIDYIISVCEGDTIFSHMGNKFTTVRSIVFDTGNKSSIGIRIHATTSNSETGKTTVKGLRVFEWDDSLRTLDLQTIGYFSGTKYVSARTLETEGKNLYPYGDVNFTNDYVGWCDAKGKTNMYGDIAQKSSTRFLLKKGTYTFSVGSATNINAIYLVDDKEQQVSDLSTERKTFTLTQDTYCTIRVKTIEANVATTVTNIQIERGETATTYEAYQSRYYKPRETEEIILRSLPNGVCDTFNLQTGEYVQNIGVAIYDGSDDELWGSDGVDSNNIPYFTITKSLPGIYTTHKLMYNCDIYKPCLDIDTDKIAITTTHYGLMLTANNYIRIKNGTTTREEFMASLKEKPVTLIYALKEPIITKLQTYDRVYNGQTNALVDIGNNLSALTYYSNNYYLKVGNLSPIPAIVEPITHIPYNVRLKENTNYTLKYNRGNSSSMTFDLGGTSVTQSTTVGGSSVQEELLIKTPQYALTHNQLILTGNGYAYNFVIVEGDMRGKELPYFEGINNVKMPIVKNIGKNLFHGGFELGTMLGTTGDYADATTAIRATDYTKVMGGKQYVFYCNDLQCKFAYVQYDKDKKFLRTSSSYLSGEVVTLQNDVAYVIMRTPNNATPIMNNPHVKLAVYEYEEGMDTTLQDYKENSIYITQGEYPITSEMIEQGGFSMSGFSDGSYELSKHDSSTRLRSKNLIPVKPNATYLFNHTLSKTVCNVYQWDGNSKFIEGSIQVVNSGKLKTITTSANTQYIHFLIAKETNTNTLTVAEYDWSQFHMYELDSTINLRSLLNGVKDELNLLTGEYIQRVGEVVLDGGEEWVLNNNIYPNDIIRFDLILEDLKPLPHVGLLSDTFYYGLDVKDGVETVNHNTKGLLVLGINSTRLTEKTIDGVKAWLQQNPITVQYELAEPIISHVRLVSNNQEREVGVKLPNGVCNTYNPSMGITTVRVGKIVLDGSENWVLDTTKTNTQVFGLRMSDIAMTQNNLYCETMRVASGIDAEIIATVGGALFIALLKTKASTVDELKTYLASNPITVWYELKYPQIQPDIVLPNGVHDEYNPETGVYTKKVGFVEFDGSEDETWNEPFGVGDAAPTVYSTWTLEPLPNAKRANISDRIPGVCNSLKFHNNFLGQNNFEMYFISETGRFNLNIERAKLSSGNSAGFNQYLSQNPIKLWYELETPITYQLTPYFGLPQPYAYEDGYLIHDSAYAETTLPPEFKYKLVANRTGQVMQNNRKLQQHTSRLSNLEALIIEATIESLFNRELQLFELELMDVQLIDLGE